MLESVRDSRGTHVKARISSVERRRWPRLPLAIPVFVRNGIEQPRDFVEFATALNVSAGGMLVAIRRAIPFLSDISLEIPSAPLAALERLPRSARTLLAKVVRAEQSGNFNLIGLKFSRPLVPERKAVMKTAPRRRKLVSSV
jgi:hypothetical protein